MKEEMYSYHYYKNRAIEKPSRNADLIFQGVIFLGVAFALVTVFHTVS